MSVCMYYVCAQPYLTLRLTNDALCTVSQREFTKFRFYLLARSRTPGTHACAHAVTKTKKN